MRCWLNQNCPFIENNKFDMASKDYILIVLNLRHLGQEFNVDVNAQKFSSELTADQIRCIQTLGKAETAISHVELPLSSEFSEILFDRQLIKKSDEEGLKCKENREDINTKVLMQCGERYIGNSSIIKITFNKTANYHAQLNGVAFQENI
eukprot:snap_masked-scaffold_5-processed-gene-19.31-mRNA-1 protein AED:1.00 eAED:1.00 QI:0/-1/0/0/-1/1/1/0/149